MPENIAGDPGGSPHRCDRRRLLAALGTAATLLATPLAADVVASLSYAALHLRTPLFVVMGHTGCGAVTAALDAKLKKAKEPERIEVLVKLIVPGLKDLDMKAPYPAALAAAVEANVRWSVAQLAELAGPKEAIRDGRIILAGAIYELETGRVRFLTR